LGRDATENVAPPEPSGDWVETTAPFSVRLNVPVPRGPEKVTVADIATTKLVPEIGVASSAVVVSPGAITTVKMRSSVWMVPVKWAAMVWVPALSPLSIRDAAPPDRAVVASADAPSDNEIFP
jgi:hypothetical protein